MAIWRWRLPGTRPHREAFGIEQDKVLVNRLTFDDQPAQLGKPMALRLDVHTGEPSGSEGNLVDVLELRRSFERYDAIRAFAAAHVAPGVTPLRPS